MEKANGRPGQAPVTTILGSSLTAELHQLCLEQTRSRLRHPSLQRRPPQHGGHSHRRSHSRLSALKQATLGSEDPSPSVHVLGRVYSAFKTMKPQGHRNLHPELHPDLFPDTGSSARDPRARSAAVDRGKQASAPVAAGGRASSRSRREERVRGGGQPSSFHKLLSEETLDQQVLFTAFRAYEQQQWMTSAQAAAAKPPSPPPLSSRTGYQASSKWRGRRARKPPPGTSNSDDGLPFADPSFLEVLRSSEDETEHSASPVAGRKKLSTAAPTCLKVVKGQRCSTAEPHRSQASTVGASRITVFPPSPRGVSFWDDDK